MTAVVLKTIPTRDWQDGVDLLCASIVPVGISAHTWAALVLICQKFMASHWPQRLAALGWSDLDLFGANYNAPDVRHDCKGLCWFLSGNVIEKATGASSLLRRRDDAVHSYARRSVPPSGTVRLWQLPMGEVLAR